MSGWCWLITHASMAHTCTSHTCRVDAPSCTSTNLVPALTAHCNAVCPCTRHEWCSKNAMAYQPAHLHLGYRCPCRIPARKTALLPMLQPPRMLQYASKICHSTTTSIFVNSTTTSIETSVHLPHNHGLPWCVHSCLRRGNGGIAGSPPGHV